MTQMAGENLFGLLSLAKQNNIDIGGLEDIDLQGLGGPFEQAESGGITNKVFDKSLTREGSYMPPLPSDDMKIREMLRRNEEKFKAGIPELEDTDFVQELFKKAEASDSWNEGTGIEKGGFSNAPQWLRDQYWKMDLEKTREAEIRQEEEHKRRLQEETFRRIELNRMLEPRFY